jgi:hypothetical protein
MTSIANPASPAIQSLADNQSTNSQEVVMKTTMFVAVIAGALFVLGCQDNPMSPVSGGQLSGPTTTLDKPHPIYLPLKGVLADPTRPIKLTEIKGQVGVSITGQGLLVVTLQTDAMLVPFSPSIDPAPWTVSGNSTDQVKLLPGRSFSLSKSYKIAGRDDGAKLSLAVTITRDKMGISRTVELTRMSIVAPRGGFVAPDRID